MGIECLINSAKKGYQRCGHCNAPTNIEKCEECGTPIYRLKSEFVSFMKKYAGADDELSYKQLYDVRSTSVHGELLRAEFKDTGFHVGGKDEQQMFLEASIAVTRHVVLRWLETTN